MTDNIISIRTFLGKYYPEILYSAAQDKYKDTSLDNLLEQRFRMQNNKAQMVVDPALVGLQVSVSGNEIYISKEMFEHPDIQITNTLETKEISNPKSLYNPEIFSTIAYLMCQNHLIFRITGTLDEPVYVKYKSDYETFYSSVVVFEIEKDIEVQIIEEIESFCAVNSVINYILAENSSINLTTFYKNHKSALSFIYRNIIAGDHSKYNHVLFGKGSSNAIDENRITCSDSSVGKFVGVVNSDRQQFHSILIVNPLTDMFNISVDYRDILLGKSNVTFNPFIIDQLPLDRAKISVSNIEIDTIHDDNIDDINTYISDIVSSSVATALIEKISGLDKFVENKREFLSFQ